jgi:putative iron-only hydrogenase system regulator
MNQARAQATKKARLGLIGILAADVEASRDRVAGLLTEYHRIIVDTVDIPCPVQDMTLTCVTITATTNDLGAFTGKLGLIAGVRVKSILW